MDTSKKTIRCVTAALVLLMATGQQAHAQQAATPAKTHAADASTSSAAPLSPMDSVLARLPADKASMCKDIIGKLTAKNAGLLSQSEKLRQETTNILLAKTFNETDYVAKMEELGKIGLQMRNNTISAVAAIASKLTAEERAQIVAIFTPAQLNAGKQQ